MANDKDFRIKNGLVVGSDSIITGSTSDETSFALKVKRANNSDALTVRNDGIVQLNSNYLYVNNAAGIYSVGPVYARGGITRDGGNTLSISSGSSEITFNSKNLVNVGTITATSFSGDLDYGDITNPPTIPPPANDGTITLSAGTYLSGGGNFTTDQLANETITFNHDSTSRTDTTSSTSPGYGGTFTAVDSVTTNTQGHVTAINLKTVTFPSGDDTDNYVDSLAFSTSTGVLTLGRTGTLADLTVDLDGRYIESTDYTDFVNVTGDTMTGALILGGSQILTSSAALQVNGFMRTGNVLVHEGGNTPTTNYKVISNSSGALSWDSDKIFHDSYHPNADKWTTARTETINLTGSVTGTGSASVDGSGNWTINIPTTTNHTHNYDNYGSWTAEDGDGTQYTVTSGDVLKFAEGGAIDVNFTADDVLTISHADTSGQASVNNSNGTVIQDITLDTYGHITSLGSVDLDSRYVNVTGDTMTGTLSVNNINSSLRVGDITGDNYTEIKHSATDGYGFDFQHNNASVVLNQQGSTNEVIVLGDVDSTSTTTLFGIGHSSDNGSTWSKKLNFTGTGEMYIGSAGTSQVFHDGYHPNADKWTTARTNTVTLTGDVTGSGNASVDGTGNWTVSIPAVVANDSHSHSNYVLKSGDTMTGALEISFPDASLIFSDETGSPTEQKAQIRHEPIDANNPGSMPNALYIEGTGPNLYSTGLVVEDRIYASGDQRVFADNYHPNADKWTTARTNTVTLTGATTGTGSASVDGSGNWTVTVNTSLASTYDNYSSWTAEDGDGTTYTVTSGDTLKFAEGSGIDVNFTADDVLRIAIKGNEIPGSVDLNTYRTTGFYTQNANADASSGSNYPVAAAGILQVINDDYGNGLHTTQLYSQYNSTNYYHRTYYNGTWSSWRNLAQDTDTNTTYTAGTGLTLSGTVFNANVSGTTQTVAANGVSATSARTYAVQVDGSDNLVVNVPWSDTNTDTNTTYSLTAAQSGGTNANPNLFLNASSGTDYNVQLVGGGITSITRNSDGQITISSTESDTLDSVCDRGSTTNQSITAGSFYTAGIVKTDELRCNTAQQLVLNAGESQSYATGQTAELVYINAEGGLEVNSSPDNWTGTGWAGRNTATICASDGSSTFPGDVSITGLLSATTKSFIIDHPTKEGMKLRYGSLEGPENGVYIRGRLKGSVIQLPEYWIGLVDQESITVNLTAIGKSQNLYIEDIRDNKVFVGGSNINCFYTVYAERKDVEKLVVEYNG